MSNEECKANDEMEANNNVHIGEQLQPFLSRIGLLPFRRVKSYSKLYCKNICPHLVMPLQDSSARNW